MDQAWLATVAGSRCVAQRSLLHTADFFRNNALLGLAAMMCTYLVGLYYIVILAWTIFYLGRKWQDSLQSEYHKTAKSLRTLAALPSGHLPWSDVAPGVICQIWQKSLKPFPG